MRPPVDTGGSRTLVVKDKEGICIYMESLVVRSDRKSKAQTGNRFMIAHVSWER